MLNRIVGSALIAFVQATSVSSQEQPQYSSFEFRVSCELLFNAAVGQTIDFSGFYEIEEPMFSANIMQEIERMGFVRNFAQKEIVDGNLELRLLLPTRTMPGSGIFIFRTSDYDVPALNTDIEYLFCRAEPITKTIFQVGVRMWHSDHDADTFYVSPEMMAEVSETAVRINTPRR